MQGFPPALDARVTLANWQLPPFNRWAFQHAREIVPTARVSRGRSGVAEFRSAPYPFRDVPVHRPDGTATSVGQVLAGTYTDGFLVLHDGRLIAEEYRAGMSPDTTHLLMSVTKSFVGCLTGILVDRGHIDLDAHLTAYVPELAGSGYDAATVRHVLDMRSGIAFSEDYLDPEAEVRILEEVIGWRPRGHADLPASMYEYLLMLGKDGEHGGPFAYRSCETDVLGWVFERATGVRMPELLSDLPGGMYRNQFWLPYDDSSVLLCLGIHGQMIYVNSPGQAGGRQALLMAAAAARGHVLPDAAVV